MAREKMKIAFLDRDGVINVDVGYIHNWDKFSFLPGAIRGLQTLLELRYNIIIITNQSGIARQYFSFAEYERFTARLLLELRRNSVHILDTYMCPHHPKGTHAVYSIQCDCRKPKPGMIKQAVLEHDIDLKNSLLIGDKITDVQAGLAAGITNCFLLGSRYLEGNELPAPIFGTWDTLTQELIDNKETQR